MKKNKFLQNFNFKSKKVLVLGGSGLIGKRLVENYISLGAKVRILDIKNVFKKELKRNSNLTFKFLDLKKKISKDIIEKSLIGFGCPNIFVNCSYPKSDDWEKNNYSEINFESLKQNINCHLGSYTYFATLIAEIMRKKKVKGNIVQFSSIYGLIGQDPSLYKGTKIRENVSYAVIKGGIINLTRSMASYFGRYNIRVNTICPGGVYDSQNSKFLKNYSKLTPLGRMANKDEIIFPVIFLSSEASSYITGTTMLADGGFTIK
mgnify:FL=1